MTPPHFLRIALSLARVEMRASNRCSPSCIPTHNVPQSQTTTSYLGVPRTLRGPRSYDDLDQHPSRPWQSFRRDPLGTCCVPRLSGPPDYVVNRIVGRPSYRSRPEA